MKQTSIFLVMLTWMLTSAFSQQVQTKVDQKLQDGTTTVDSIDRWQSSVFARYRADTTFSFSVPSTEVLRGTLKIISSQKYNNWTGYNDVTNHHIFPIQSNTSSLRSNLVTTNSGNVIKAKLISSPAMLNSAAGATAMNDQIKQLDEYSRAITDSAGDLRRANKSIQYNNHKMQKSK